MKLLSTLVCGFFALAITTTTVSAADLNAALKGTTQKRIISHKGGGTKTPDSINKPQQNHSALGGYGGGTSGKKPISSKLTPTLGHHDPKMQNQVFKAPQKQAISGNFGGSNGGTSHGGSQLGKMNPKPIQNPVFGTLSSSNNRPMGNGSSNVSSIYQPPTGRGGFEMFQK
jgi:hypothetical protein